MTASRVRPIFPVHGDCLHARDGATSAAGLTVTAKVAASPGSSVFVNGQKAAETQPGLYAAPVTLTAYTNQLTLSEGADGEPVKITVHWLKHFAGHYRLSVDDNIRFLQDIATREKPYASIFENPYLGGLKKIHDAYGTKIHLNLFYQSVDGDFNLSSFPDRYREEWAANRDWLRLSFHAYGEFPDAPYEHAPFDVVKKDCDLVQAEIRRFAGDTLLGPVTTVHWGAVNIEGSRALRAGGYRGQLGYFNVDDDLPSVSYYLSPDERRHMKRRFVWKDENEDIVFIRSSVVLDRTKNDEIEPVMNAYAQAPSGLPPYVDYLIHEQYFYPDYAAYQPDYFEKIETAARWAKEQGYEPAFLDECIFD